MPRIKMSEFLFLKEQERIRKQRNESFRHLISGHSFPDEKSSNILEAAKAVKIVKEIKEKNFDIFDIVVDANGVIAVNENDTHG